MGANVTTFIDTLLAAALLNNPAAFTVVLISMLSITLVSIIILGLFYYRYERAILAFVTWVAAKNSHFALFLLTIFVMPLILILV